MIFKITIAFILITNLPVFSQEKEVERGIEVSEDAKVKSKSNYNKDYFTEIKLANNLWFQQEMNSRIESDYVIFEFPLLLKYNITKKLSFLAGPKIDLIKYGVDSNEKVSLYTTFGIQYEVSNSMLLEARYNYRLTNETLPTDYTFGSKSSFTLGSKIKF